MELRTSAIASPAIALVALIASAALLLSACGERRPAPQLEIVNATLTTSAGQFDFRTESRHSNKDADTWNLTLVAEPPGLRVAVLPAGLTGLLMVSAESDSPDVSFVYESTFYELNFRDQQLLSTRDAMVSDREGRMIPAIHFTLPEQLDGLIAPDDTTLRSPSADRIRAMKDDVHRLYFEFAVDGAPHVVDVAFRLDVGTDWDVAVPTGGLP